MTQSLGDRMKRYEHVFRGVLPPRMPIIMRVDGKAFHTYTRDCRKPFDERLMALMDTTAQRLCAEIQGAQIAFVQSDEISIFIHGYKRFASQSWFSGEIQKMVSCSAAVAAATFTASSWEIWVPSPGEPNYDAVMYRDRAHFIKPAFFDSRVFAVPESDVCNYFIWRQQDIERNSIQMLARSLYSHRECNNKDTTALQEMCKQKGHDWNDLPTRQKRGRCVYREGKDWAIDNEIPRFVQEREYIEKYLAVEEI